MVKNIIFDLGKVIINYSQQDIIDKFAKTEEEKEYLMEKNFNSPEWQKCDLGEITNEEACNIINERENNSFCELTKNFWQNWYKTQAINEDVVDIARELKNNGYNLYVLSNMANPTYNYFSTHDFFKLCTGIVISAQEGVKKPDERIFNILLTRYNLKPEECIFIDDDDTGKSFETASKLGLLGRRVLPNNSVDVRKVLKEYGVKL